MLPLVPISIQQSRFRTRAHGERDVKTALVSLTPLGTWNLKNRTDNYISKSFGANWRQLAPIGAALVCGHTPENRQIGVRSNRICLNEKSSWRQLALAPIGAKIWRQRTANYRQLAPTGAKLAPKHRQFGAKLAPKSAIKQIFHITRVFVPWLL